MNEDLLRIQGMTIVLLNALNGAYTRIENDPILVCEIFHNIRIICIGKEIDMLNVCFSTAKILEIKDYESMIHGIFQCIIDCNYYGEQTDFEIDILTTVLLPS